MQSPWFRPKRYGYGLTPVSWQGWLATLIFVGLLLLVAYTHGLFEQPKPDLSPKEIGSFIIDLFMLSGLFLVLMKDKTEGELKWQWGDDDKSFTDYSSKM